MTAAIEALEKLLSQQEEVSIRDAAGVIIPEGIDAKVRVQTIKECIRALSRIIVTG